MAGLGFGNVKGSGTGEKIDRYKITSGDNSIRLFGNILPRYQYWLKNAENRDVPFECLAFNRATERFDTGVRDHVQEQFPDVKAKWAYSMMCLDKEGNAKLFDFKSKLFQQIMAQVGDLGDPTDPQEGWDVCFSKSGTGLQTAYTLQSIKCLKSKGPLTEKQLEAIAASKTIEELLPLPTSEEQLAQLRRLGNSDKETTDESAVQELGIS